MLPYTYTPRLITANMPKKLERKLRKTGVRSGLSGERLDAYIYGTLRKTGWRPASERNKIDCKYPRDD